jgi:hypothetical protein
MLRRWLSFRQGQPIASSASSQRNSSASGSSSLLRLPAVARRDAARPIGAEPDLLELVLDRLPPLREVVSDVGGDAGDAPVVELAGRTVVGLYRVAERDGRLRGSESAGHRRRVDEVADAGGVEGLPAAAVVEHRGETST